MFFKLVYKVERKERKILLNWFGKVFYKDGFFNNKIDKDINRICGI